MLFPRIGAAWDADTLNAVMVHEISHVARRDALTERVALPSHDFLVDPLSWWLRHRLAQELAEEASDQAARGSRPASMEILLEVFGFEFGDTQRIWNGRVAMAQAEARGETSGTHSAGEDGRDQENQGYARGGGGVVFGDSGFSPMQPRRMGNKCVER